MKLRRVRESYKAGDYRRVVDLPDMHIPFHDPTAIACALAVVQIFKPHTIFIGGDGVDCYQISRFSKDPRRRETLQDDLDTARGVLQSVRKAAPDAGIYYLQGNHEYRATKILHTNNPELATLRALDPDRLLRGSDCLGLDDLGIRYVPRAVVIDGLAVKHGNIVRQKSGYSARGELERNMISGFSNHTHRLGFVCLTTTSSRYRWIECGCLCDLRQLSEQYLEGATPDWQQGLGYGYLGRGRVAVSPLEIENGATVFQGMEITA